MGTLSRKEKIRVVAEREAGREKRGRIESVLLQALTKKHGPRSSKPWSKQVLKRAVGNFLDEHPSFIDGCVDIRNVERIVDDISPTIGEFIVEKKPVAETKAEEDNRNVSNTHPESGPKNAASSSSHSTDNKLDGWDQINPWTKITMARTLEAEDAEVQKRQQKLLSREKMATRLNEQLRLKQNAEEEKRKEDERFVASQNQKLDAWRMEQAEEARRAEEAREKAAHRLKSQIDLCKDRRKMELKQSRSRELAEIAETQQHLLLEEERKRGAREKERAAWERIKAENAEKLKEREQENEKEKEWDAKLMADMKEKLDREEANRAKQLADRKARIEEFGQKFEASAKVNEEQQRRKEERMILKEIQAKERRDRDRERCKKEAMKQTEKMITETNKRMADEKRKQMEDLERSEEEYAVKSRREGEAVLAEEHAKKLQKAAMTKQYSQVLKKQIEQQEKINAIDDMNNVERSINKELMTKIDNDPLLQKKILDKLVAASHKNGDDAM